jgi:hypothetical protein
MVILVVKNSVLSVTEMIKVLNETKLGGLDEAGFMFKSGVLDNLVSKNHYENNTPRSSDLPEKDFINTHYVIYALDDSIDEGSPPAGLWRYGICEDVKEFLRKFLIKYPSGFDAPKYMTYLRGNRTMLTDVREYKKTMLNKPFIYESMILAHNFYYEGEKFFIPTKFIVDDTD